MSTTPATETGTTGTVTALYPRLVVAGASRAIDFYVAALGAEEVSRYTKPDGKIVHSEVRIGPATVAVKDEGDGEPAATSVDGIPVVIALDVTDADAVAGAMERAGATVVYPVRDQPYGARAGRMADPFGHLWMISQQIEDLSPEEVQQRTHGMYGG